MLLTISITLVSIVSPEVVTTFQLLIAGVLVAIVGIPHGATDYMIFKDLAKEYFSSSKQNITFFSYYALLLLGYTLVWIYLPVVAFLIFLILSVYHFGQSNFNYIKTKFKLVKWSSYLVWGSFVILVPVSIHIQEASKIINNMTSTSTLELDSITTAALPRGLFVINLGLISLLCLSKIITLKDALRELMTLSVLLFLFYNTPLLVGFTVYFAFWHSYGSVLDQIRFIRTQRNLPYTIKHYYIEALPMILLSFLGMGLVGYINMMGWIDFSAAGLFFILIAIVTLPHMLVIEQLYHTVTTSENNLATSVNVELQNIHSSS